MTDPPRARVGAACSTTLCVSAGGGRGDAGGTLASSRACSAGRSSTAVSAGQRRWCATLLVFAIHRAGRARGFVWDGVFAVSDGLLSLTEGDYGVRLAVSATTRWAGWSGASTRWPRRCAAIAAASIRRRCCSRRCWPPAPRSRSSSTRAGRVVYANASAEQFFAGGQEDRGRSCCRSCSPPRPRELQEAAAALPTCCSPASAGTPPSRRRSTCRSTTSRSPRSGTRCSC